MILRRNALCWLAIAFLAAPVSTLAQNEIPDAFTAQVRAGNASTLMAGQTPIMLWGVESVPGAPATFKLKARTALDNVIGQAKVQCEVKKRTQKGVQAQCNSANDQDLGLFMLQQGYVTADRTAVYDSVFEDAYIQAETEAQDKGLGVWAEQPGSPGASAQGEGAMMISFGFVLFLCIIAAFAVLSIIIMRGFQKVIEAQNDNVEMMSKERRLRNKERGIVVVMLSSELKANKAKIEAFLVVYEEMLKSLKDPDKPPKYKKAGDIVQKQPSMDRSVFDRNTDKIDILGGRLSSELIHFYARIKTSPDYINLEPEMEQNEVINIVDEVVDNAQKLNQIAEYLIEKFESKGVGGGLDDKDEA